MSTMMPAPPTVTGQQERVTSPGEAGRGRTGPLGLVRVRADRATELAAGIHLLGRSHPRIAEGSAGPLPNKGDW